MYEVRFLIDGMDGAVLKADTDYSLGHLIAAVIDGVDDDVIEIRVAKIEEDQDAE